MPILWQGDRGASIQIHASPNIQENEEDQYANSFITCCSVDLALAIFSLRLHFNFFGGVSLDFDTPEAAIKTIAKVAV